MEYIEPVLDVVFSFWLGFAILTIILVKGAVIFVPQNMAYIVERFGKYTAHE